MHDGHTICVSQHGRRINIEIRITMVGTLLLLFHRPTGMRADEAADCRAIEQALCNQVSMARGFR